MFEQTHLYNLGLLSPFQERPSKMDSRTSSCDSLDTWHRPTQRPPSSCCSDDSASVASDDAVAQTGLCFCGRPISPVDGDEDESRIYCSSACARQDALIALLGGETVTEQAVQTSDPCTPHAAVLTKAAYQQPPRPMERKITCRSPPLHDSAASASMALQLTTMGSTHYRRMGALQAGHDSYPSDVFEEAFMTPMSGHSVLDDEANGVPDNAARQPSKRSEGAQHAVIAESNRRRASTIGGSVEEAMHEHMRRVSRESRAFNVPITLHGQSPSADQRRTQRHIISLPSTPSLDSDEEAHVQRHRQEAIEQEIRDLDNQLKRQLQNFDKQSDDILQRNSIAEEEDDVLMNFSSPRLDYEAPLGWRRGTRVYSTNFLGLHLQTSPGARSISSDQAVDHGSHQSRLDRLHVALEAAIAGKPDEGVGQAGYDLVEANEKDQLDSIQANIRVPSALDMARELAFLQATWNPRHVTEFPYSSIGDSPDRRTPKSASKTTSSKGPYNPSAPAYNTDTAASSRKLRPSPSKHSLSNFFSRRPSHHALNSASGISSADLALTPRMAKSSSPRFAILGPAPSRR